ncbi:MAG: hypothetical protein IH986_07650 [Planctomycetes bacterium]|nr:hypothetical protein [Planctomycetota bacterium]
MSAIPEHSRPIRTAAHAWFDQHLPELTSRCNAYFRRRPALEREEAVADVVASVFRYVLGAETRGKLHLLTPFTLVSFFARGYCEGRRMAGYSSTDVMSEAARRRHGLRVISLEDLRDSPTACIRNSYSFSEMLADSKADRPPENARRNIDYPEILERAGASDKAKRIFHFLCQTVGEGRQVELARKLRVSPARITQLKGEVAACLAAHGYLPPATRPRDESGRKPRRRSVSKPRSPRMDIPLNAGSSPPRRHLIGDRGTRPRRRAEVHESDLVRNVADLEEESHRDGSTP